VSLPTPATPEPTRTPDWTPFVTKGAPINAEYRRVGSTVHYRFVGDDGEMIGTYEVDTPPMNLKATLDLIDVLTAEYREERDHLAALLDGVLADDPAAIRDAAAWLAANRPEVDG
jgi:hypothetical protein